MARVIDSKFKESGYEVDDTNLESAMVATMTQLRKEMKEDKNFSKDWRLVHTKDMTIEDAYTYLKLRDSQVGSNLADFMEFSVLGRKLKPDGGIIWLVNNKKPNLRIPVLMAEMKSQGTNKGREEAGLKKQAVGNAIERLSKYIVASSSIYAHDDINPMVGFCTGCDFSYDENNKPLNPGSGIMAGKLVSMNPGFASFNKVYTRKNTPKGISPVTICAREEKYNIAELVSILKEVGMDSLNYFKELFK